MIIQGEVWVALYFLPSVHTIETPTRHNKRIEIHATDLEEDQKRCEGKRRKIGGDQVQYMWGY